MTDNKIKRVSAMSVKAMKDETNWDLIYSQIEASIIQNIDNESPELKQVIYKKSQKKR